MKLVLLASIADIQLGKMLSPKAKTGLRPFPYLRNTNVQWGHIDTSDLLRMDFSEKEQRKFVLRAGDLLVCEGGEPGRCAVWRGEITDCYYQKALHRVRPHEGKADTEFLALWLRHQSATGAFEDQNAKTTIAHLPLVRLEQLLVPDLDVTEQRQIAARLKAQLAEVETARQAAREQVREVANLINAIVRQGASYSGAETVLLGDVIRIDAKIVDPTKQEYAVLPHISAENISSVTGLLHNIRSAADDGMESGKYLFDAGDVLYSKLRPYLRKATTVDFDGLCSADMYPIKFNKNRVDADFLRFLLVSDEFTSYTNEKSARSRMPKLNREQLFAYECELPPLDEQRAIVTRLKVQLAEVDTLADAAAGQLTEIERLPSRILAEAFGS